MRRRTFLSLAFLRKSPRNELAEQANVFFRQSEEWSRCFNRVLPGTVCLKENAAFEPLGKMWRQVEKLRDRWIRGIRRVS